MKTKLKPRLKAAWTRFFNWFCSLSPVYWYIDWKWGTPLPTGHTEFKRWAADVAELSGLPNNPKLHRVTSDFIFQVPPTVCRYSKRRLANQLRKAAANQVASEVIRLQDEKAKQEAQANASPTDPGMGSEASGVRLQ